MNTQLVHQAHNGLNAYLDKLPTEGGFLTELDSQNTEAQGVIRNLVVTAVLIGMLYMSAKSKFAFAAIIGSLIVGALMYFGVNGGFEWVGGLFKGQAGI